MPSRFISRITARPRSFRPCHFGGAQQESAKLLAQLCAGSCTERSPSRYRSRSTPRSPSRSKPPSRSSTAAILPALLMRSMSDAVARQLDRGAVLLELRRAPGPSGAAPAWSRSAADSIPRSRRWRRTSRRCRPLWRAADRPGRRPRARRCRRRGRTGGRPRGRGRRRRTRPDAACGRAPKSAAARPRQCQEQQCDERFHYRYNGRMRHRSQCYEISRRA